jgi:hypothetical protein
LPLVVTFDDTKEKGVSEGFRYAIRAGTEEALSARMSEGWDVMVFREEERESYFFRIKRNGVEIPRKPEPHDVLPDEISANLGLQRASKEFIEELLRYNKV